MLIEGSRFIYYESAVRTEGLENNRDCSWSSREWSKVLLQERSLTELTPGEFNDMISRVIVVAQPF